MRRLTYIIIMFLTAGLAGMQAQESLSLQDCLEMSDNNNPYVRNSRLDILSSKAMKGEVTWEFFPTVSLDGMGYYAQNPLLVITPKDILGTSDFAWELNNAYTDFANSNGLKTRYSTLQKGYGMMLTATQPIYAGGRIVNGNRLAAAGVEASELQADLKLRDIREEVEGKYWLAVALQEKMITLNKAQSVLDSLYRFVCSARDAGLVVAADVTKVSSKRSELASGKVKLKNGLKLAKMDLFNAIGFKYEYLDIDNYTLSESIGGLTPVSEIIGEESGVPVESRLLEIQEEAKRLEKKVVVGEFLPQVGVGMSYGYGDIQGRNAGRFNGVGFVSVKIPLTGIGKATMRARRMEYEVQKVSNEREYLESQLQLQRHQLYLAIETAYSQAEVSAEALKDAEDAERRSLAEYKAGRIPLSDLLQAELSCRTASEQYIDDCIEYHKAVNAYRGRYVE